MEYRASRHRQIGCRSRDRRRRGVYSPIHRNTPRHNRRRRRAISSFASGYPVARRRSAVGRIPHRRSYRIVRDMFRRHRYPVRSSSLSKVLPMKRSIIPTKFASTSQNSPNKNLPIQVNPDLIAILNIGRSSCHNQENRSNCQNFTSWVAGNANENVDTIKWGLPSSTVPDPTGVFNRGAFSDGVRFVRNFRDCWALDHCPTRESGPKGFG